MNQAWIKDIVINVKMWVTGRKGEGGDLGAES